MTDDTQERADRDHERSEEAHWQVAEAGAEEEERLEADRQSHEEHDDWENEGGGLDPDPEQAAEGG